MKSGLGTGLVNLGAESGFLEVTSCFETVTSFLGFWFLVGFLRKLVSLKPEELREEERPSEDAKSATSDWRLVSFFSGWGFL